jgi:hypothetical protein
MQRRRTAVTVLAAVLAAGLAACGSDDSPSDGAAAQPTPSTAPPAQPTTTAASTGQPAETAQLDNGRHPVVLERVDVAGRTVTVDLVQWFTGEAAAKAAAEDGEESPPPNDYYVRNVNPRLRTLPLATDARLTLTGQTAGPGGSDPVQVDLARLAASGRQHLFWATVQGGRILRLEEQYLP